MFANEGLGILIVLSECEKTVKGQGGVVKGCGHWVGAPYDITQGYRCP